MLSAVAFGLSWKGSAEGTKATVVGLVTPHLLRAVELAAQAEKGVTVRPRNHRSHREISNTADTRSVKSMVGCR
jgi:hypothetical protein